jgi:pimeloyl-ACP methyl ester carboxylesterase
MTKVWRTVAGGLALALAGVSCGGAARVAPAAIPLRWAPCEPTVEGAECATMTVPRDHGDPGAGSIEVGLLRFASEPPSERQLWYLAGGPGGAGTSILPILQSKLAAAWRGVDFYTLDHRGTGRSARLSCPAQEAPGSAGDQQIVPSEVDGCLARLRVDRAADLPHLTVTASARDLARAIEATRGDARVFLWGNSYGTYWAQRFLQLHPDVVDGVFLEALTPADGSYRSFDYWMNDAGMRLMRRCAAEPTCRDRFPTDPVALAEGLPARLAAGHCAALDLPVRVSWFLGSLLYSHALAGMVPLLVRMLDRCSAADVARLQRMYRALFRDRGMLTAGDFSAPLYAHVVFSEMWGGGPPGDRTLEDVAATCLFCPGDRAEMDRARERWPVYVPGPPAPQRHRGPVWLLQGGFDPAMPPEATAAMRDDFRGEHQHYIAIANGAHVLPGATPTPGGADCGLALLTAFLADPEQTPPAACAADVLPIPLPAGPPGMAGALLGAGDPWEGEPPP